jgi:hypothetical protein
MSYHAKIMNLPRRPASMIACNVSAYAEGERDARHAAAEIACDSDAEIAAYSAENERLRAALLTAINSPMGVVPDCALEFYKPGRRSATP